MTLKYQNVLWSFFSAQKFWNFGKFEFPFWGGTDFCVKYGKDPLKPLSDRQIRLYQTILLVMHIRMKLYWISSATLWNSTTDIMLVSIRIPIQTSLDYRPCHRAQTINRMCSMHFICSCSSTVHFTILVSWKWAHHILFFYILGTTHDIPWTTQDDFV